MNIHRELAHCLGDALWAMNSHINSEGMIARSSAVIRLWHTYTNDDWFRILGCVRLLCNQHQLRLHPRAEQDVTTLIKHLQRCESHCDNVLYPTPKITNRLPNAITNVNGDTSIKTVTFRAMMNIRESLCVALDIDLPNLDTSKGLLDPTPYEQLFQGEGV